MLCEQNWSLASSISEKWSAHHNTKEWLIYALPADIAVILTGNICV
jgi:hypothetical protein